MEGNGAATILHADLDAFYASVEQLLNPNLRGKPIAVGGGVVLAASYEAKAFGVRGGMAGRAARELCPQLIFVDGHFRDYQRLGDQALAVLDDYTPLVERISIDEAFADVAGTERLFGSPEAIARQVRTRVKAEVGLPISVGVARTKHLAKIASQVAKPDGLVMVEPGDEQAFLEPLPVSLMWGVGPVTQHRLATEGIHTIGELARSSPDSVQRLLGVAVGAKLSALAHNEDPRRVVGPARARSVGAQSAMGRRQATPDVVRSVLGHLADRVATRLRAKERAGRTVTVRVRFPDMHAVTRSTTLNGPISATLTLTEVAEELAWQAIRDQEQPADGGPCEISLLAISVSNLAVQRVIQLELPLPPPDPRSPGSQAGAARWAVDSTVDAVRAKFGTTSVDYLPAALGRRRGVPDDFRGLAEREL